VNDTEGDTPNGEIVYCSGESMTESNSVVLSLFGIETPFRDLKCIKMPQVAFV